MAQSWKSQFALVAALLATVAASLAVIPLLVSSGGIEIMLLGERFEPWELLGVFSVALCTGGAAASVSLALFVRRSTGESAGKGLVLAAVPAGAMLLPGGLAAYQLSTAGALVLREQDAYSRVSHKRRRPGCSSVLTRAHPSPLADGRGKRRRRGVDPRYGCGIVRLRTDRAGLLPLSRTDTCRPCGQGRSAACR